MSIGPSIFPLVLVYMLHEYKGEIDVRMGRRDREGNGECWWVGVGRRVECIFGEGRVV